MRKELGGNILKFLFFGLCLYGIIRISIWSYVQTQLFFVPFDYDSGNTIISNAMAMIFQYGQNVTLFMCAIENAKITAYNNKSSSSREDKYIVILEEEINKSRMKMIIYYILFGIFAIVDGLTNVGQFLESQKDGTTLFIVLGVAICLVVVFVEEIATDTLNAILHAFNDILESLGIRRIVALDSFIDPDRIVATRMTERFGNGGDTASRPPKKESYKPSGGIFGSRPNQKERISQPSSHLGKPQGKPGDAGAGDLRRRLEEMRKSKGNTPMGFSSIPQRPEENEEGDDF